MIDVAPRQITQAEWIAERRAGLDVGMKLATSAGGIEGVLLAYQKRLLAATAAHRVVLVSKSRRIGATWGVGADAVVTSSKARSAGGMDTFYIGYNLDMAREFIDVCGMWARAFNTAVSATEEFMFDDGNPDKHIQAFRIRNRSAGVPPAIAARPPGLCHHRRSRLPRRSRRHDERGHGAPDLGRQGARDLHSLR